MKQENITKKRFIYEIGVEELPSPYFDNIYNKKNDVRSFLENHNLAFDDLNIYITPRRIIFELVGLSAKQLEEEILIKGPAYEKAFIDGKPTKALEGFLKSKNASLSDVIRIEDKKRAAVAVKSISGGRITVDVLREILPNLLKVFNFPRNMSWNSSGVRFPRPIRWILALYGDEVIDFEFAGLKASNVSYGHRYISSGELKIDNADKFFAILLDKNVIYDEKERIALIEKQLENIASESSYDFKKFDSDLIDLVARLSESPFLIEGFFAENYLNLPKEVLATCMKKHQKIFACYRSDGSLANSFCAVLDGKRENIEQIRTDYENVLMSRLKDAEFFIAEDLKEPFVDKLEKLKGMVFFGELGTLYDKALRLESIINKSADILSNDFSKEDIEKLALAGKLAKVDLITNIVYEFPELQGVAGCEYLKKEGYDIVTYSAVREHYLPRTLKEDVVLNSDLHIAKLSAWLGIADRFDTLFGAFAHGIEVSGSEDPYALRRIAGGIVKLVKSFSLKFSLISLFELINNEYDNADFAECIKLERNVLKDRIFKFIKERIIFELSDDSNKIQKMLLDAVINSGIDDLREVFVKYNDLSALLEKDRDILVKAVEIVERTKNISKNFKGGVDVNNIDASCFEFDIERNLYTSLLDFIVRFEQKTKKGNYIEATRLYVTTFFDKLRCFFDEVLVNVNDEKVKCNRLLLLKCISDFYCSHIADLSLVRGL